ncbi:MAG: ABC transporter permease [Epulopiscium sp.]|jgi:D-methionine transport system permease protein|nr:ABC transporter permease [Candidatus Epulonipiscium sp.]
MFSNAMTLLIAKGIGETLYMTLVSTLVAYVFGLPLGLALVATDKDGIFPFAGINQILGIIINILRSIPFLILMVLIIPLTRAITGTIIGSTATIVPLVIAAAPFIARLVESSLKEVDHGIVEAAESMGATPWEIMFKVLLPEAKPSLLVGSAIAVTTILSYSAMAGIIGGGGLGAIALNYGLYRYQKDIMIITVILLVIIVQILQETGMKIAKRSDKRN